MSKLTEILDPIESLRQEYDRDKLVAIGTRPIFTTAQIDEKLLELTYKLPKETIEFYDWLHSRHDSFIPFPEEDRDDLLQMRSRQIDRLMTSFAA